LRFGGSSSIFNYLFSLVFPAWRSKYTPPEISLMKFLERKLCFCDRFFGGASIKSLTDE
jgi:hypothetical protein